MSLTSHSHSHTLTHTTGHSSHHLRGRGGPAGTGGTGPDQASKGGRNGEFWQVLGWAGLASRDNFGAMFQVPEDKAHLRRESNSRHVSESGPHAPGPMYLQGSRNVSEVPRGPCQCTSCRSAYMAVRPVLSCPWGGGPRLNTVGIRSVRAPFCVAGLHIARNSVRPLRETSGRSSCDHSTTTIAFAQRYSPG